MSEKITFGFKNLNGVAFNVKIMNAPRGRFPNVKTANQIRNYLVKVMNKHGKEAERLAKTPGWSPRLTGALVKSIKWHRASAGVGNGRVVRGSLQVSVPYGRRQEFENRTKAFYLLRAIQAVQPAYLADLQDKDIMEDILFARRRQVGESGVVRGSIF